MRENPHNPRLFHVGRAPVLLDGLNIALFVLGATLIVTGIVLTAT